MSTPTTPYDRAQWIADRAPWIADEAEAPVTTGPDARPPGFAARHLAYVRQQFAKLCPRARWEDLTDAQRADWWAEVYGR